MSRRAVRPKSMRWWHCGTNSSSTGDDHRNGIWQDLRFGARMLRKSPGFTTAAVLSLALGIGANTAIFQLLDAVRLKTLPVASPHELTEVRIVDMDKARGRFSWRHHAVTNSIWEEIRDRQQA